MKRSTKITSGLFALELLVAGCQNNNYKELEKEQLAIEQSIELLQTIKEELLVQQSHYEEKMNFTGECNLGYCQFDDTRIYYEMIDQKKATKELPDCINLGIEEGEIKNGVIYTNGYSVSVENGRPLDKVFRLTSESAYPCHVSIKD